MNRLSEVFVLKDLILKSRSYRRFYQDVPISRETLMELVDLARCSPSGLNRQPLKYILSWTLDRNARIFPQLLWAARLRTWKGPVEGERPSAYVVVLGDKEISETFGVDHGIAAQNILLAATERGLGGCMFQNVRKDELRKALGIPARYEVLLVIALGRPKEKVVLETVGEDGDTAYWRDSDNVHHVPKRRLEDIIVEPVVKP